MTHSLDKLRREAKALRKAYESGAPQAQARLRGIAPRGAPKHADFLHAVARAQGFASWPHLKAAAEVQGLDRAQKQQRLKVALYHGQNWMVDQLLNEAPDLAEGLFGLQVALLNRGAVAAMLAEDPGRATRLAGPRRPILHLAFSKRIHARPDLAEDMIAIAELLVAQGADVNDAMPVSDQNDHPLSALYGAIGHADNMVLGRWLLEQGADPNDGESLYHATELGHHDGLRMLLAYGADPKGTNALYRAMDFNDHAAVGLLLQAGALAEDYNVAPVGGERPWVFPALHQAARRMNDARMVEILLDAGADPGARFMGAGVYGMARVFGNRALAQALEARGQAVPLTPEETLLATAADGEATGDAQVKAEQLPPAYRNILRELVHLPDTLDHLRRLVALGLNPDRADREGLTPVQVAGWAGLPDVMGYFLSLGPDLTHVNGYGGTLLSTIVHGSENCPERAARDHVACARLALAAGVPLPRKMAGMAGNEEMAACLNDWAEAHPEQVAEGHV